MKPVSMIMFRRRKPRGSWIPSTSPDSYFLPGEEELAQKHIEELAAGSDGFWEYKLITPIAEDKSDFKNQQRKN